jgi:phage repressor protein C with HTH and peptisase S24 domain
LFHVKPPKSAIAVNRDARHPVDMARTSILKRETDEHRAAIERFRAARKLTIAGWARRAGIPDSTLRNYLAGGSASLLLDNLSRLARAESVTVSELLGEKLREQRGPREVMAIKSLEVRAAMGGGCDVVEEPEGPPFYFRRDWVEKMLAGKPGQLRVMTELQGDSMLPTITEHDVALVLVGNDQHVFQSGKVHAIWDGQGLVVKRLLMIPGRPPKMRIQSDNAALYQPIDVSLDDVRVIGRVIWRGGIIS